MVPQQRSAGDLHPATENPVLLADVQGAWTGVSGALVLVAGAFAFRFFPAAMQRSSLFTYRYPFLLFIAFLVMAAYELAVVKVHHRHFDFAHPRKLQLPHNRNVLRKWAALTISLVMAGGLYVLLWEYHLDVSIESGRIRLLHAQSYYAPFFRLFAILGPLVVLFSVPYFYLCERFRRWTDDEDEYLTLADGYRELARLRWPGRSFSAALRSLGVKFFFLPLMVVYFSQNAGSLEKACSALAHYNGDIALKPQLVGLVFQAGYELIFFLDVGFCVIGYSCTMRLFDTHVRWAEPTAIGWVVALACYAPFNRLTDTYLSYNETRHYWGPTLAGYPVVHATVALLILLLLGVYVAATVMFGLRFSNLTHRGILSKGPYAIVRHPAYAAKNLAWWLMTVPFMYSLGDCLRLFAFNMVYVARAITEERHLRNDPHYREYMNRVRYRFIPGVW